MLNVATGRWGEYLELPRHGIWCRHASAEPDFLELLLDEIDDGFFRFRRDQAVTLGLDKAFIRAFSGLPILAPEIALLYKSSDLDAKSWADVHVPCLHSTLSSLPGCRPR